MPTAPKANSVQEKAASHHPFLFCPAIVEFQVTTQTPTLTSPLGSSASLHCSFSKAPGLTLTSVEWRLQHQGHGRLVYRWTPDQRRADRPGATLEPDPLLEAGGASLTLPNLVVEDEGTYVCQVTTSQYQAQQIAQLHLQGKYRVGFTGGGG